MTVAEEGPTYDAEFVSIPGPTQEQVDKIREAWERSFVGLPPVEKGKSLRATELITDDNTGD